MCDHCGCRSIPAIAELTAEHETILELAWATAEAHGRPDALAAASRLLEVLEVHVAKEETALYPLLSDTGDLTEDSRRRFEEEHVEIRAALLAGSFDRNDYYALAAHAEAEENELFPVALFGFDDRDWADMAAAHAAAGRIL